jgi:hypothetical protein
VKSSLLVSPSWAVFTQHMIGGQHLRSAYDFRNWKGWFPDIGYHERFTLMHLSKEAVSQAIDLGFYFDDPEEKSSNKAFQLTPRDVFAINPNTGTLPVFDSPASRDILLEAHSRFPVFGNADSGWSFRYGAGFHMSGDAAYFRSKEELESLGFQRRHDMSYQKGSTEFLPLIEGKLIHQFDHRFASFENTPVETRFGRKPSTHKPTPQQKQDNNYEIEPRYWVESEEALERAIKRGLQPAWAFVFRNTTNVISNVRTAVGTVVGRCALGEKAPNLASEARTERERAEIALDMLALFNSFAFDFIVRQKFYGANFTKGQLEQVPVPHASQVAAAAAFLRPRVLDLIYTSHALDEFAKLLEDREGPRAWDPERREVIRAEIDSTMFHYYGFNRQQVEFLLDTFPILNDRDEEQHGEYRTKRLCLEAYDRFSPDFKSGRFAAAPESERMHSMPVG